jgi:hypothetical protein
LKILVNQNEGNGGRFMKKCSYFVQRNLLKDLLGITVVSTDFKVMGETAAMHGTNKENGKVKNPFSLINRNSM